MKIHRDIGWWYWLMTLPMLTAGLSGWSWGFAAAMVLCVIQVIHFAWRDSSFTAFPVQVRAAYLILLILGQWTPLHWILWVQLVGTSVRVLVGYCLLARTLSLLPWNRFEPWSMALLGRTYFSLRGPSCSSRSEEGWAREGARLGALGVGGCNAAVLSIPLGKTSESYLVIQRVK